MADPKIISASKIACYRECPLAFSFQYYGVDGKRLQTPKHPAAAFGSEIHYMADQFYKKKSKGEIVVGTPKWADVEKCIGTWKWRWLTVMKTNESMGGKVNFSSEEQKWVYYWEGVNILKGYYQKMCSLPWPLETEKRYNIEIAGEKAMAKIDRLDRVDGELIVTDYKSDKISPEKNTFLLHRSPQFTLYSYAIEQTFHEKPGMVFLHLRSGKGIKTKRGKEDYDYLENLVRTTAQGIRNDNFVPFYGFHCGMCGFRDNACRENCIGADSKLKALEHAFLTTPEIANWISFPVPKKKFEDRFDRILKNVEKPWVKTELMKIFESYEKIQEELVALTTGDFWSALNSGDDE
jgi:hypothetical protein